ncbi:MAG: glycosyltransferase [Euryarchaeota archaeon]
MAGEILLYGQIVAAGLGLIPFAWHRLSCKAWMKYDLDIPKEDSNLPITILLPVWNEGLIIEKKLADLAKQEVKANLLLIDSASSDDTVEKAEKWLKDFPDAFQNNEIIVMEQRLGKTAAVKQAVDHMKDFKGIVVMTDADATIAADSFYRIRNWFSDKTIGAVGGTPQRKGRNASEQHHRDMFSSIRIAESHYDSTPFLEGSLLAWRSHLLDPTDLYSKSNADDAQIATAIRLKGFRTIQDSELFFQDYMPVSAKDQRRQKVRRGQGLIRLLARKRKYWFSKAHGRFSRVLAMNSWMMLFSPLLLFIAMFVGLIQGLAYGVVNDLDLIITIIEIYCITAWFTTRMNIPIPFMKTAGAIFYGLDNLLSGIILAATDNSLHMWEQHEEIREEIARN